MCPSAEVQTPLDAKTLDVVLDVVGVVRGEQGRRISLPRGPLHAAPLRRVGLSQIRHHAMPRPARGAM